MMERLEDSCGNLVQKRPSVQGKDMLEARAPYLLQFGRTYNIAFAFMANFQWKNEIASNKEPIFIHRNGH